MMNQITFFSALKPFTSLLIHSYIFFIIFSLLTTITLSNYVDPKFQACEPKTCGNGQNISFPFYIKGKQEPFCGYPRFELTCGNGGFPILTTNTQIPQQYIVEEIFYNNESLRVSIPMFSKPTTTESCIPLSPNFPNNSRRFSVAPKQKQVLMFYGCNLTSLPEVVKVLKIVCSAENQTSSVLAFYSEDPNLGLARENCEGGLGETTVEDEEGGIEEGLKRGFVLKWTSSNCDECNNSGGRCGFDVHAFKCYCRDRVHDAKCDLQLGLSISPIRKSGSYLFSCYFIFMGK